MSYILIELTLSNEFNKAFFGFRYYEDEYKVIKSRDLIWDDISIKCAKTDEYRGEAVYEIALAGSFESDSDPEVLDFYVARFNTRANFTINFYESETPDVSEQVRDVYIDADNDRIYAIIDINVNKYENRNVVPPGIEPTLDNPNIAIVALSFDFGTRLWVTLIGDIQGVDYFSGLSIYNGHLYVALTSYTTAYSNDITQTDIIYTKIRSDNGLIVSSQVLGSSSDDTALDIEAGPAGVYIMAIIGDEFLPHYDSTKYWEAYSGAGGTTFAILLIRDSDSTLIDIEGFDLSAMTDPIPRYFSMSVTTGVREFIFFTTRANDDLDGLYFTKFTDSSLVFVDSTPGM